MKEKLRELYSNGTLTVNGLLNAAAKSWITIEDVVEIVGEDDATEVVRAAKLSEISSSCNAVIVAGVDVETSNGTNHFNLSIEDQNNINNLFRVVELGGTEYPYQSDGGICYIYSAADIASIYVAAQTLITTQTAYHNALKRYVQALEDAESISQVTYGMELPDPYQTELLGKLMTAQTQMQSIMQKIGDLGAV